MCREAWKLNTGLIESGKLDVHCEDAQKMSFRDAEFDVIVCINTVYFWENIDAYLKEIKRVLKKGGILAIGYRQKERMENLPYAKECFRLFSTEELSSILENNGFRIIADKKLEVERKNIDGNLTKSVECCLLAKS
jgi:SAM-dependent methyltransferase